MTASETANRSCVSRTTSVGVVSATAGCREDGREQRDQGALDTSSLRTFSRTDGEEDATADDARPLPQEHVRDATGRAGLERLTVQRVREPFGSHILSRPVEREERDGSPGSPSIARSPRTTYTRAAPMKASISTDSYRLEPRATASRKVVEPTAVAAEHDDPLRHRARRERARDRSRPSLPGAARRSSPASARATTSGGRVEVADCDRHLEAERDRMLESLVRGDHGHAERHLRSPSGSEGSRLLPPPLPRSTRFPPLALPRSGSAGRRRRRPLSPLPELPVTLGPW